MAINYVNQLSTHKSETIVYWKGWNSVLVGGAVTCFSPPLLLHLQYIFPSLFLSLHYSNKYAYLCTIQTSMHALKRLSFPFLPCSSWMLTHLWKALEHWFWSSSWFNGCSVWDWNQFCQFICSCNRASKVHGKGTKIWQAIVWQLRSALASDLEGTQMGVGPIEPFHQRGSWKTIAMLQTM